MSIEQLRKYSNWVDKSPVEIRKDVMDVGGWAQVFPVGWSLNVIGMPKADSSFPIWASRVRNFFNVTPVTLELLQKDAASSEFGRMKNRLGYSVLIPPVFQQHAFALNGDVYADENGRPWFEMDKVGGVYHTPGPVNAKKIYNAWLKSYASTEIFKLISPDDTGGSMEVVIYNAKRESTMGAVGEEIQVSPRLVRSPKLRGSYNYAETVIRGSLAHTYSDVIPHSEDEGFYVNPPLYSSMAKRRFPAERDFNDPPPAPPEAPSPPLGVTDPFGDAMAPPHYPRQHPKFAERIALLELIFTRNGRPKHLLARIESRNANDRAVRDFHNPAIIPAEEARRLVKILRDRPGAK